MTEQKDIDHHLVEDHGFTWKSLHDIAHHPSLWLEGYHARMHNDPTAANLNHSH